METKTINVELMPCRCGARQPVVAKIKPRLWAVACKCCPTRALGVTETAARSNWNVEVQR